MDTPTDDHPLVRLDPLSEDVDPEAIDLLVWLGGGLALMGGGLIVFGAVGPGVALGVAGATLGIVTAKPLMNRSTFGEVDLAVEQTDEGARIELRIRPRKDLRISRASVVVSCILRTVTVSSTNEPEHDEVDDLVLDTWAVELASDLLASADEALQLTAPLDIESGCEPSTSNENPAVIWEADVRIAVEGIPDWTRNLTLIVSEPSGS